MICSRDREMRVCQEVVLLINILSTFLCLLTCGLTNSALCYSTETVIGIAVGGVIVVVLLIVIAFLLVQRNIQTDDEYMNLILVNHRDIHEDPKGPKQPLFMNKQVWF